MTIRYPLKYFEFLAWFMHLNLIRKHFGKYIKRNNAKGGDRRWEILCGLFLLLN